MKSSEELRSLLRQIDRKSYPAYKDTKGKYQFPEYVLSIDHVQGDPFASPSKVSVLISGGKAAFDRYFYESEHRRIAFQDHLLRHVAAKINEYSFKAKGSGKSGLLSISRPGQEILERSACIVDPAGGDIAVRMEIGFPANGRTVNSGELEKILFDFLPACVRQTLFSAAYRREDLKAVADLADDRQFIREKLPELNLAAFVANGSVLPRKSGISSLPMKDAVAFCSPASMEVTLDLPHHGPLKGMGIRKGVTLIVGGGYHGKSTLLEALELGVYGHIAGDGREYSKHGHFHIHSQSAERQRHLSFLFGGRQRKHLSGGGHSGGHGDGGGSAPDRRGHQRHQFHDSRRTDAAGGESRCRAHYPFYRQGA